MGEEKENIEGEGFVIKDKRSSRLSEEEAEAQPTPEPAQADTGETQKGEPSEQQFQIDFSTFVLSLTSSAFYNLGDLPDPVTGKTEANLPAVQQTIDMLIMLKEKTQGNLTQDELKLVDQMIYELQMKFMEKKKT